MADLFQTTKQNISLHVKNVFDEGELDPTATVKDYLTVRQEGDREVERSLLHYNLDVIISVGYRVKSQVGTRFRIWATQQLRDYLVKGFILDDRRFKEDPENRHFEELLQRIRDIRSSEKVFQASVEWPRGRKCEKEPAPNCRTTPSVSNGKPIEGGTRLALLCGLRYIPCERTCITGGKVAKICQQDGRLACDGSHYDNGGAKTWTLGSSTRTSKDSGVGVEPPATVRSLARRAKATLIALTAKQTLVEMAGLARHCLGWDSSSRPLLPWMCPKPNSSDLPSARLDRRVKIPTQELKAFVAQEAGRKPLFHPRRVGSGRTETGPTRAHFGSKSLARQT